MQASCKQIPVYRMHQPSLYSPCLLGDPCDVCRVHGPCRDAKPCRDCRRGRSPQCQRAQAAVPAFTVKFSQALALVRNGLADFINRQTALRLTFSKIAHLRDQSLRIDERFLMAYAQGDKRARAIMDDETAGWSARPRTVFVNARAAGESSERLQYFV
jgi:hypothetical protein